jgi:hypothetical protein
MDIDTRVMRIGCLLLLVAVVAVTGVGRAGEVSGRVVLNATRAHVGEMLGGPGAMSRALDRGAPTGPVLVYVGEASAELPRLSGAPARLRMTAGGLTPALQAVCVGSTIEFENADGSAHRLVAESSRGGFDLGWQAGGTTRSIEVREVGLMRLSCSLEHRSIGELVVLPHSCFALADASGSFRLPNLPPGPAVVVAYAPGMGEVSRQIEIPVEGKARLDLSF